MKVHTSLENFSAESPVLTTGTFDGVHLGHQKIITRIREIADKVNGETVVFTFDPHPRTVLFPDDPNLKLLTSKPEKIALMEQFGVDHLILFPFTKEFSRLTAVEFVRDVLVNQLHIRKLVIGYDHQFGRNREGSIENLRELSPLYNFEVEEIPAQEVDDVRVSSTKIRQALFKGDVKNAAHWLGHTFQLSGIVIPGRQVGRNLGFPTANLRIIDPHKLIPADGSYAVMVKLKNEMFRGMMNIGLRPTVNKDRTERTIEVHLFDFSGDLYNEVLHVQLMDRIRDEKAFSSVEELKKQLSADKETAIQLLR